MINLIFILSFTGTVAFAVAGAISAIEKKLDIFGVILCGFVTATGGGIFRDILLSKTPPSIFTDYLSIQASLVAALMTFIMAWAMKNSFESFVDKINGINNVFDAAGLGVFSVVGTNIAIQHGFVNNAVFAVFLGVATGCGGGIVRDMMLSEIPAVLKKRIYALASIVGSLVYYEMSVKFGFSELTSTMTGIILIFVIRMLASRYHWNLPRAI